MAIDGEMMQRGVPVANGENQTPPERKRRSINWCLLIVNCICLSVGTIGGPLVMRLYYLHGGNRKWLTSWLQTAGFPMLFFPLFILYIRDRSRGMSIMGEPKMLVSSAVIGILSGLDNFMYSQGVSFLPVSTSSLLFSSQLAFTAFFAFIIVRQKFTPYSINSVILMTLGAILLGIRKSGDRPPGVSNGEYMLGFILTLGAAAVLGFIMPCVELTYSKANNAITYTVVVQFQLGATFFATIFSTVGMLINKDFQAIPKEAREYGIGEAKYYMVLVSTAIVFQLIYIGSLGLIFCTSSLFAGIITASLLPLTEIAGVIFYHEKFNGEKGMALALCLWGFISYFYGSYKADKKQKVETESG